MSEGIPLTIVVAVADNGVIGRDNDLPWRLRTDLARFKRLTVGKPLIMGRRNWESIGRPLPGRHTIVITRDTQFQAAGAETVHSWEDAVSAATVAARDMVSDEVIVAGGGEIYRLAMPVVDRLRLTQVHASPAGDILFPSYDERDFVETFREDHPAGPADEHPFTFVDLERRRDPPQA